VLTQEEAERTGGGTFMSVMQTAHGGDLWIDQ
jgi:hypothetical protein